MSETAATKEQAALELRAALQPPRKSSAAMRLFKQARPLWVIAAIVVFWELLAATGWIHEVVLPRFSTVVHTMWERTLSGELPLSIGWSTYRVVLGFSIGLLLAFPLGLAIGWWRVAHELFNPIVEVLRPVPPLAWIPLAVIWFGVGFKSVMFITVLGSFFPICLAVIAGVQSVDKKVIEYSQSLGASTSQILRHVVIPSALPGAFVGMRIAIGFSWMVVVAAEMISVKYGLGWMIWRARFALETDAVIAGMIAIGVLSVLMTRAMMLLERRIFRWRENLVKG
jgi:ABC-type nitrate/sulfonate/bicarbonate transport system permease component